MLEALIGLLAPSSPFVVLFLEPATSTVPSSGTLDCTDQPRSRTAASSLTIAASRRAETISESSPCRVNGRALVHNSTG